MKKVIRSKSKCCQQCFAYVQSGSRKCRYCGYIFKSPGKYLLDKIKQAFNINRVYYVDKSEKYGAETALFTTQEVDSLLEMKSLKILMYMVMSDINFLDETSLIELGKTMGVVRED